MKAILVAAIIGLLTPVMACEGRDNTMMEEGDIGKIHSLNIDSKNGNKQCILEKVKVMISYIDNQQIAPFKVEIWKGHSLVEETLKQEVIKIERPAPKDHILFPIQYKGQRIILYNDKKQSYAMYGIISKDQEIDFSKCFK